MACSKGLDALSIGIASWGLPYGGPVPSITFHQIPKFQVFAPPDLRGSFVQILELPGKPMLSSPLRIAIRQNGLCRARFIGAIARMISTTSSQRADTPPPLPTAQTLST